MLGGPTEQGGRLIGVICPDAAIDGAYFAATLAWRLAERCGSDRGDVCLIDGQPSLGGLDVLVDLEAAPGARWGALAQSHGPIDGARLLQALPHRDGVAVLSHTVLGADCSVDVVVNAIDALRRHAAILVLPLAAAGDTPAHVLSLCDEVIIVVRGTVGGLAAARATLERCAATPGRAVLLETSAKDRIQVQSALDVPVIDCAPTRWKLSTCAAADVLVGKWPGESDRTMTRLVDSVITCVRSEGRTLAWV